MSMINSGMVGSRYRLQEVALRLGDGLDHEAAISGVIEYRAALARTPHAREVVLLSE